LQISQVRLIFEYVGDSKDFITDPTTTTYCVAV